MLRALGRQVWALRLLAQMELQPSVEHSQMERPANGTMHQSASPVEILLMLGLIEETYLTEQFWFRTRATTLTYSAVLQQR